MVTRANASVLAELEAQREQELAEARAIQMGMLPHGPLRTADVSVCYEFQPFHEVGGDFLDFFTLTDGTIGIYLRRYWIGVAGGAVRGIGGGNVTRCSQDRHAVLRLVNRRVILRG